MTQLTKDQVDKIVAGRDECWNDLLLLRDYYNELCNQAVKLGIKFEDLNPKANDLIGKIGITEMRVKHPYMLMPGEMIPVMPKE